MTAMRDFVKAAVDPAVFRRGDGLARSYGVSRERRDGDGAVGVVVGRDGAYEVRVELRDDGLAGRCECIAQMTMPVCKHMVALALVAFADVRPEGPSLEQLVAGLPQGVLARLVLDTAARDPALRARVEALADAHGGEVDVKALRSLITRATTAPRDPSWRAAARVAERADEALGLLEGLVDARADQAPVLAEHMIVRVDRLLGAVDDSGGPVGGMAGRARDLHMRACAAADVPPGEVAKALLRIARRTEWDWVDDAPERYAELLGDDGLAALDRALAKARASDRSGPEVPSWQRSHVEATLARMAESSARAAGDTDRLVAAMAGDLSSAWRYVQVADVLEQAGREREALEWLERGRTTCGDDDGRLRERLTAAYMRDGREEEALELAWGYLRRRPSADAVAQLRGVCGDDGWPQHREAALATLARWPGELVRAHVADGDAAAALAVAEANEIDADARRRLARALARVDIRAALGQYEALLEGALVATGRPAYRSVADLLREMHDAASAHGSGDVVVERARAVKEEHRRRPALVEAVDALGWW